jgi:hypothetical protein
VPLSIREASAVCTLIDWARGRRVTDAGTVVTDDAATEAARILARCVNRINAGPDPDRLSLRWTHAVRERLVALAAHPFAAETQDEAEAIRTVLDLLDRIDRNAA